MPRPKRWSRFHVEPLALLNDPDFLRMLHRADGSRHPLGERAQLAYVKLWFASWNEKEPGVVPHLPARMASMSDMTVDEWAEVEPLIVPAVRVRQPDGAWVFAMMADEAAAQERRYKARKSAGKRAANARWHKEKDAIGNSCTHATPAPAPSPTPTPALKAVAGGGGPTPALASRMLAIAYIGADEIEKAEALFPKRDIDLIAAKVMDRKPDDPVGMFWSFCRQAEAHDWDRKPVVSTWGIPGLDPDALTEHPKARKDAS